MSHKLALLGILGAIMATGCAHNPQPALSPTLEARMDKFPPLPPPPAPMLPLPTLHVMVDNLHPMQDEGRGSRGEVPCGHSLTVKVGKLDVDMPKGGSLDIGGVKGQTNAYHVILEGVEFTNTDHCLQ